MGPEPTRRTVLRAAVDDPALGVDTEVRGRNRPEPPDRHVVGVEPGGDVGRVRSSATAVDRELDFGDIGTAVVGRFPDQALDALRTERDVRYVEPDYPATALAQIETWGIDRIDADVTRSNGQVGSDVDVAVLDTGIDSDHPDLAANIGAGRAFIPCGKQYDGSDCSSNAGSCDKNWDDDEGHGTHVAGTVAAVDDTEDVYGVASAATLHAGKVLDCNGYGTTSAIADGLKWAADQGYDVANMSLGFGFDSNDDPVNPSALEDAVEYAHERNVVQVAAAGNDGRTSACEDDDQCVQYPAAYPEVIAVSALMRNDDIAPYSNRGDEIELGAPGGGDADGDGNVECTSDQSVCEYVYSTYPTESSDTNLWCLQGTSMASPHVAGVAALAESQATVTNHRGVRDRLDATAEDVGLPASYQGNGLVDAASATPEVTEWSFDVGARCQYASPALDDTHVYVGGLGPTVYALNRSDGSVSWSFTRDGALADSTPLVSGSYVLVGSGGGSVYRLSASDGSVDWSHTTDSAHVSSPTVVDGVVYIGSNDGTVLALDESTGGEQWTTGVGGAVYAKPVVANGSVFVTTADGDLVALSASDGSEQWRFETGTELGHSGPAVGNGRVFVAADLLYARDQSDGSGVWSTYTGAVSGSTPAYDGTTGYVFVGGDDGYVYALDDANSGSTVWEFLTAGSVGGSPTVLAESLVIGGDDGILYVLDAATGRIEDDTVTLSKMSSKPVVGDDGTVVTTWDGTVEFVSSLIG